MKTLKLIQSVAFIGFILTSCGNQENNGAASQKITIATAANMQFAMEDLTNEFTRQTGKECELVISSSGKLTAQIKEGAPYDVFVSGNMKYPREIYKAGLAETHPEVYAHGKLVLWSVVDSIQPSIELLSHNKIEHIALANPKTAPYGVAAVKVLEYYTIYGEIEEKLVFGESIAQTNQFITSRSAEIGFTAKSVVLSPHMKGKGKWMEINDSAYVPIKQGVVVIKHHDQSDESAQKFYAFLFSEKAKEILINFGYSVDE